MNKLFAIAFMCIYLLLSVGVVKTTHYCMGREKSTELFSFQAKKCPCSLFLTENSDCCKDEHEVLSIDDSQAFSPSLAPVAPDFFLIGNTFSILENKVILEQSLTQFFIADFSPPPKEPLYQINCSLVFYDDELSA
jgi:hypothetical protein